MADFTEQNQVRWRRSQRDHRERYNVMNVEWHIGLLGTVQATPLTRRVIALPDQRTRHLPFLASVEGLPLRCNAPQPTRIEFAALVPHWIVSPNGTPSLELARLNNCAPRNAVLTQPEEDRCIRDAELVGNIAGTASQLAVLMFQPFTMAEWLVLAPVGAALELSFGVSVHTILYHIPNRVDAKAVKLSQHIGAGFVAQVVTQPYHIG